MLGTARLLGQTLGAVGVALLFRAHPEKGSNLALGAAALIALVAAVVSMVRLRGAPGPTLTKRAVPTRR
jgi:hypothetical protein